MKLRNVQCSVLQFSEKVTVFLLRESVARFDLKSANFCHHDFVKKIALVF